MGGYFYGKNSFTHFTAITWKFNMKSIIMDAIKRVRGLNQKRHHFKTIGCGWRGDLMDQKDKQEEKKKEDLRNAGIAGAAYETVQRYGSAAKQHYVAYSGKDNEIGKTLVKGLKQISQEKINPEYQFRNIHQQAGFAAEVKSTAKTNAENIINGNPVRKSRTDDMGSINDPLYDTVMLDRNGDIIKGFGTQMKFLGASEKDPSGVGNAKRTLEKLQTKKFEKYLDKDVKIEVPSDQYDEIKCLIPEKVELLSRQLENQKRSGNLEQTRKIQRRIDKLRDIDRNLRKSNLSLKEAEFARNHPVLSTAGDVTAISHRAGIESMQTAALFGGGISIIRNLSAVCGGEEDPEEALANVARDTASSTAVGYATGFTGSALKGAMQNSVSTELRALSKTNVAGTAAAFSVAAVKTFSQYFKGEIDGVQCMEDLGENDVGMLSSAMFAAAGEFALPKIGGLVGYTLTAAMYEVLLTTLREEKMAHEERIRVEKQCEEMVRMIREYRKEMEVKLDQYFSDSMDSFREVFSGIENALALDDTDWFIDSANAIIRKFGGEESFLNLDEFNKKMLSGEVFKL